MSVPAKLPGLPHDVLRPQFWKVAADRSEGLYATPFEKHRVLAGLSIENMAPLMIMYVDEYAAFEQGKVRAVPHDILAYCEALELHPLDLYAEPYPGMPLPVELRDVLQIAEQSPLYDTSFRKRAYDRLMLELERSNAMLEANVDELHPLLISLGYAPGLQNYHVPFYDCENENISEFLQDIIDGGTEHPRGTVNAYLNAYNLVLEEERDVHLENHQNLTKRSQSNDRIMHSVGTILYGNAGIEFALERLRQKIIQAQNISALKEDLLANPETLGRLTFAATNGLPFRQIEEERRLELQSHLRLLFVAARHDVQYDEAIRNQSDTVNAVAKVLADFVSWRESPRTQCLLDWFENWLVLDNHLGGRHSPTRFLIKDRVGKRSPAP